MACSIHLSEQAGLYTILMKGKNQAGERAKLVGRDVDPRDVETALEDMRARLTQILGEF